MRTNSRARRTSFLALLVAATAAGCIPQTPYAGPGPDDVVRVHERATGQVTTGRLVRLSADSVAWRPDAAAGTPASITADAAAHAAVRALPLTALSRLEVRAPVSQRDAFHRGALRGAIVGALLGGGLLAARDDAAGAAVGITLGSAWLGGVFAGQGAGSSRPPTRWRTLYPGRG